MNKTHYIQLSTRLFRRFYDHYAPIHNHEKNIKLAKANINMGYDTYCAFATLTTLLVTLGSFISSIILYLSLPHLITFILIAIIPMSAALLSTSYFLYGPRMRIKRREYNLDLYLPYAINFISSMAVAGISPSEIFQSLASLNVYGDLQIEAKRISKEINIMGSDSITALKHAIDLTPSKKFRAFLQGIIGTIQSGSDLYQYLTTVAEKYMQEDLRQRKKDLDLLGVIAEVFVISAIAFPIFLVIILTIMGFFGGSMTLSMNILLIFSLAILPLVYVGFYYLIKSTSIEELNRLFPEKKQRIPKGQKAQTSPLHLFILSVIAVIAFYAGTIVIDTLGLLHLSTAFYLDSLFIAILIPIGVGSMTIYTDIKRKKEIQSRLPEFLIELGDSLSTGMTIFEAIKTAEKGHYGELKPEINHMKKQLSWNVSIKTVFTDFAAKMRSAIIHRIIVTINKGLIMGGSTPKIFKAAAREITQVNELEDQRKKNMSTYTVVVMLCFFVFLAIILILNSTIFASFFDLQLAQQGQPASQLFSTGVIDPIRLHYVLYTFVFVQSIGAGLLSGFMMDGNLASGARYSCLLGLISFTIFKLFF